MTLKTSLVQRLTRPPKSEWDGKVTQAFSGIGMMNKEQWEAVQRVFDVHYMGAAEYEFGALPNAFRELIQNVKEYGAWSFVIPANKVKPGYWRSSATESIRRGEIAKAKSEGKKPPRRNQKKLDEKAKIAVIQDKTIYVFGPLAKKEDVEQLIREVADETMWVKNGAGMASALDPDPSSDYDEKFCGWFDLYNKIFWFTDEKMCQNTATMFTPTPIAEQGEASA